MNGELLVKTAFFRQIAKLVIGSEADESPRTSMLPLSGWMIRRIMRIVDVLPEPLGPINPYRDPAGTFNERLATAVCWPYVLVTSEIRTTGKGCPL